jgi:hypothetical protein
MLSDTSLRGVWRSGVSTARESHSADFMLCKLEEGYHVRSASMGCTTRLAIPKNAAVLLAIALVLEIITGMMTLQEARDST